MFRKRGENLHSIYVLLFLNVAFYFLEHQDESRFASLFAFDGHAFASGQWWRILSYQFTQAGEGYSFIPKPVFLFFTLLILYFMGAAIEEEWGTRYFLTLFVISTAVTAGLAAWLSVPLLGSFFVRYTLLFVYASLYPDQTFYLFAVVPIRVRWLAYLAVGLLGYGVLRGGVANIAVFGGAAAGYVYFLLHRMPSGRAMRAQRATAEPKPEGMPDYTAVRNGSRYAAIRKALAAGSEAELSRLLVQAEGDIVPGVNICPPADYKPEAADGYCIRCEGFAECSARYIRLNGVKSAPPAAVPEATP